MSEQLKQQESLIGIASCSGVYEEKNEAGPCFGQIRIELNPSGKCNYSYRLANSLDTTLARNSGSFEILASQDPLTAALEQITTLIESKPLAKGTQFSLERSWWINKPI